MNTAILRRLLGGLFLFLFLKGDSCSGGGGATVTCDRGTISMELAPGYASPIPDRCEFGSGDWVQRSDFLEVEVREVPSWIDVESRGPETYLLVVAASDAPRGSEGTIVMALTWRSPGFDEPLRGILRIRVSVPSLVRIDPQDFYAGSSSGLLLGRFVGPEEPPLVIWDWSVVFRPVEERSPGSSVITQEGPVARVSPVYPGTYIVELEVVDDHRRSHRARREIPVR